MKTEKLLEEDQLKSVMGYSSPNEIMNDEYLLWNINVELNNSLKKKSSIEAKTFQRLEETGISKDKIHLLLQESQAVEWYFEIKYELINERKHAYRKNLENLPEKPSLIPDLQSAIESLENTYAGIPFEAIEYLHNNESKDVKNAVIKGFTTSLKKYMDADMEFTIPLWYSIAAEGHPTERLLDPVFEIINDSESPDWLLDQAQYLGEIIAKKNPQVTAERVLEEMEKPAPSRENRIYYLFGVFHFVDFENIKDRFLNCLEKIEAPWHHMLIIVAGDLFINEALPILKKQEEILKKRINSPGVYKFGEQSHLSEIREAIQEIETGKHLYPDQSMPFSITRGNWKEYYKKYERRFYGFEDEILDELPEESGESDSLFKKQGPVTKGKKTGRNDPCPCGSGKKYKKCCLKK